MQEVKVTRTRPPAWDWDGEPTVTSGDRAELEALRLQVPRLRDEVQTLRGEIADTAEAAERLRSMLRRVATAGVWERRRLLKSLRRAAG